MRASARISTTRSPPPANIIRSFRDTRNAMHANGVVAQLRAKYAGSCQAVELAVASLPFSKGEVRRGSAGRGCRLRIAFMGTPSPPMYSSGPAHSLEKGEERHGSDIGGVWEEKATDEGCIVQQRPCEFRFASSAHRTFVPQVVPRVDVQNDGTSMKGTPGCRVSDRHAPSRSSQFRRKGCSDLNLRSPVMRRLALGPRTRM